MTGIKADHNSAIGFRNTTIVGLAIALRMGVTQANAALATFPAWVTTILVNHQFIGDDCSCCAEFSKPKGSAVEPVEEKAE